MVGCGFFIAMKISSQFKPNQRIRSIEEAERTINDLHKSLNAMKRDIERGVANQGNVTINVGGVVGASGSSSTTASGSQLRSKSESLTANVTKTIVFSSPLGVVFTIPSLRIIDSSGYILQDYTISNITAAGFDILAPVDCTLYYLAVQES